MTIRSSLFAAALLALLSLTGTTVDAVNAGALPDRSYVPSVGAVLPAAAPVGAGVAATQQILAYAGLLAATTPLTSPSMAVPPKNPKVDSHLVELAAAQLGSAAIGPPELPQDLQSMITARLMRIDAAGRVQLYVDSQGELTATVEAIQGVGGVVQRQDGSSKTVQALVPIPSISALATSPSVRFVRLPDYGIPQAGSVTTEGDAILKANLARADHGIDGSGVRVGVISDGVGGLNGSQASGDLPSINTSTCNISGTDPQSTGAEGTALLEIVHDIAPGAELWFGHFETGLDFLAAVHCLAAHTDVVVDDISFLNAGLYDGTSIISANTSANLNDNANPVRAYVTNAGNFALSHYQENYSPCPSSTLQQFKATSNTVDMGAFGQRCDDPVAVGPHATLGVFLQWNDPSTGSCNDYDLYLYIHNTAVLLASSTNLQNCSQIPAESLAWVNPLGSAVLLDVVIDNPGGLANQRSLDLFTTQDAFLNFDTPGSSIPNEADAGDGVITAGAINASDPGHDTIEPYSDEGPTNDGRTKPDITGVDCVSVTGAGGFPSTFCGTSAAAPHIAGIAALLLQCESSLKAGEPGDNPAADRANLRNALLNNAVDLGATGPDNVYGWGRADAKASADSICQQASPSPTQSPTPTPTHSPTPTPTQSPQGWLQGDANCSGGIDIGDVIVLLQKADGLVVPAGCPSYQDNVNCDNATNSLDALDELLYLAHAGALPAPSGCAAIGSPLLA